MLPRLIRPPRLPFRQALSRLALLFTATYGVMYYCYKYFSPTVLNGDSTYYYPMYRAPLDFHAARSPFVLRQVSAVLTYLVWKAHIFYPNHIAFVDPTYDQHSFFAAIFTNWVCFVFAMFVTGLIAEDLLGRRDVMVFLVAAFLCMLSFHSMVSVINDLADGPAWLLMALAFLAYQQRSLAGLGVVLALAAFEREMILLAIGFLAVMEVARRWRESRFEWLVIGWSGACFLVYLSLRRKLGGWDFQSHPGGLVHGLLRSRYDRDLFFQGFLAQNTMIIAVVTYFAAGKRSLAVRYWLPRLGATFAFLALVSLGCFENNGVGRLAGIVTPIFAAFAAVSLASSQSEVPELGVLRARTNALPIAFMVASFLVWPVARIYQTVNPIVKNHPRANPAFEPKTEQMTAEPQGNPEKHSKH